MKPAYIWFLLGAAFGTIVTAVTLPALREFLSSSTGSPSYVTSATLTVLAEGQASPESRDNPELETAIATCMEMLAITEVRKRAAERVSALRPELETGAVDLRVDRPSHTTILKVSVRGAQPEYASAYLNALLDEFISYEREIRHLQVDNALGGMKEELTRLEKKLSDGDQETQQRYDILSEEFRRREGELRQPNHPIAILERATTPIEI